MAEIKYKKIYDYIKEEILNGHLLPNQRLPKEEWFEEQFNVSYLTYNKAMNQLMIDGYIVRYPKRGSFVASEKPTIKKSLAIHESFTKLMKRAGFVSKTELLKYSLIKTSNLDHPYRSLFKHADYLHYFERLRYADGRPICISYTYFSADVLPEINPLDLNGSFSELLKSKQIFREKSHIEICATAATSDQQEKLQTDAITLLKQKVYWYREELVEITYHYFICDDFSITQDMTLTYKGDTIEKTLE